MDNDQWQEKRLEDHEARIRSLEALKNWVIGAAAGMGFAIGALSTKIAALFGK